ncbi:MAG TPA: ATP-binding cassette domain-containing protein, partial [Firmicutes bacterium]|nr:ATP-binding cassette domain-containing protein [Bacillota bacterium]
MIRIENISKVYEKPVRCAALRGVSLVFPDTGLVVVAGESGSGKTTLVNILSGLDTPTSGSVEKD